MPLVLTLFCQWGGEAVGGVIQNNLMSWRVRKKMPQIRKIPRLTRDFINERSLILLPDYLLTNSLLNS